MPEHPSSGARPSRLSGLHLAATSFAAVAGVAIAAWQILTPAPPSAPVQVTVAVAPATTPAAEPAKADAAITATDLSAGAHFSAALNDGVDQRYDLARLFDGKPDTGITLAGDDRELNVLVSFANGQPLAVKGLDYVPPPGAGASATTLDVAVLPAGQMEAAGLPIHSFALPAGEAQSFTLPAPESGKAVWLRIASDTPTAGLAIGDIKLIPAN